MEIKKDKIIYRRAKLDDIEILVDYRVRLLNEVFNHQENEETETLKKELLEYFSKSIHSKDFIIWLAEYNGKVISISGVVVWQTPPWYECKSGRLGYIFNTYTIQEARGKGVCTRLLSELIKEAELLGITYLHVYSSNDAISIYRKAGFVEPSLVELELRLE
jgi:ribosomal protein S18 acetylase RimI-like enzyme